MDNLVIQVCPFAAPPAIHCSCKINTQISSDGHEVFERVLPGACRILVSIPPVNFF